MGIVGAIFIIVWAKKLLRDTSGILLDKSEIDEVQAEISQVMSVAHITNAHVWRIGSEQLAAIISIATSSAEPVEYYKQLLLRNTRLKHVTVEVSTADVVV